MLARLCAKALLLAATAALVFFGIGLLGISLAGALVSHLGAPGAYAAAGAGLLVLALLLVGMMALFKPRRPPPPPFVAVLLQALARDVPWAMVLSTGVAGVAEMLRKRKARAKD